MKSTAPSVETLIGRTVRWTWTTGPTTGVTHEHTFHPDHTVTWAQLDGGKRSDEGRAERYGAERVSEAVHLVSYLGTAGFTLTVALNFENGKMVAFASNEKDWFPAEGTFELLE